MNLGVKLSPPFSRFDHAYRHTMAIVKEARTMLFAAFGQQREKMTRDEATLSAPSETD
jgi:hypothetical protein